MGGLSFNNSMTIDAFRCIECKEILKPPVILTSIGNMCGRHKTQNMKNHKDTSNYEVEPSLRNINLEQIMEHVTCVCSYEEGGCKEMVKLHEISEHEQSCKFKTFTCMLAGCEWFGVESGYVSHLHTHTDYIKKGSDGMFPLECGTDGTDDVLLLRTISGLSLLHIKVLKDKLICAIYNIKNQYSESYKIWITCSTSLKNTIHNVHLCEIVDSLSEFINFEAVAGTEIKFDYLNPVNNKNVTVCLEHVFKGEIVSQIVESQLKCDNRLLKLLETTQVRLACEYASHGCREKHALKSQHVNISCYYKSIKCCAETGCTFMGSFTKLVDHMENNHLCIHHNQTTIPLNSSSHKIAFIVYGNIFILKYKNKLTAPKIDPSNTVSNCNQQNVPSNTQNQNYISCYPIYHPVPHHSGLPRNNRNSASTRRVPNLVAQESNDTSQSYLQMKWQVLQLTNHSDTSVNFGVEVTISSTDGPKSFHYKDGFKKNNLNEDRFELLLTDSVLKTLVPQCSEARVCIIEI